MSCLKYKVQYNDDRAVCGMACTHGCVWVTHLPLGLDLFGARQAQSVRRVVLGFEDVLFLMQRSLVVIQRLGRKVVGSGAWVERTEPEHLRVYASICIAF